VADGLGATARSSARRRGVGLHHWTVIRRSRGWCRCSCCCPLLAPWVGGFRRSAPRLRQGGWAISCLLAPVSVQREAKAMPGGGRSSAGRPGRSRRASGREPATVSTLQRWRRTRGPATPTLRSDLALVPPAPPIRGPW
jgi:hypothetical protein